MKPEYPLEVYGFITKISEGKEISDRIKILLPLYKNPDNTQLFHRNMLFPFSTISENIEIFLRNWITKFNELEPIFDLYFGILHSNSIYPVTMFLNYAQALETYHIRTKNNYIDPPDIHKKRISEIITTVPTEYISWLKEKLAFSNHQVLSTRLKEIITMVPWPVKKMSSDIDQFIQKVKTTRNYYTHYDPELKKKAITGGELGGVSMILGLLLEAILLHELGMDFNTIEELQKNRNRIPDVWY